MRVSFFCFALLCVGLFVVHGLQREIKQLKDNNFKPSKQDQDVNIPYFAAVRVKNVPGENPLGSQNSLNLLSTLNSSEIEKLKVVRRLPLKRQTASSKEVWVDLIKIRFSVGSKLQEVLRKIEENKRVLFIEPSRKNTLALVDENLGKEAIWNLRNALSLYDNKPYFWWQKLIDFHYAVAYLKRNSYRLNISKSGKSPLIAVLDSGVDYEHPALKKNMWVNPNVGKTKCGEDKHGCDTTMSELDGSTLGIGQPHPYGTSGPGQFCTYDYGNCAHGTQVAGLIVGSSRDYGMIGLCPMCKVMALKVMKGDGRKADISDDAIISALNYIAFVNETTDNPVRIINASFGKFEPSLGIKLMLHYLRESYGTILVAAAGNENTTKPLYPASQRGVISVGALNAGETKSRYSNYGMKVSFWAPGGEESDGDRTHLSIREGLLSTSPGGHFETSQGTSFAAPVVSGAAGFLLSFAPELTADELETILLRRKTPLDEEKLNVRESLSFLLAGKYKEHRSRHTDEISCGVVLPKSGKTSLFPWLLLLAPLALLFMTPRRRRTFG